MVIVDGNYGEGGGDLLRLCLSISAISGVPVFIKDIRYSRSDPGLQLHHLATVNSVAKICSAKLTGANLGSNELLFEPNGLGGGDFIFEIHDAKDKSSAGSIAPVLNSVLLPLVFAEHPSHVVFTGATCADFSIPLLRIQNALLPNLSKLGITSVNIKINSQSWYPKFGGEVELFIEGGVKQENLSGLTLRDRGVLKKIKLEILYAGFDNSWAKHKTESARNLFPRSISSFIETEMIEIKNFDRPSATFFVFAEYQNITTCFENHYCENQIELVEKPCQDFLAFDDSKYTVDFHLSDQLVLPLSLSNAESYWFTDQISNHLKTNIWLCNLLLGKRITYSGSLNKPGEVFITGSAV